MGMILAMLYVPLILLMAALVIFGGPRQRRICLLALVAGGTASFVLHFVYAFTYAELSTTNRTFLQVASFPLLVAGTWLVLTLISFIRSR